MKKILICDSYERNIHWINLFFERYYGRIIEIIPFTNISSSGNPDILLISAKLVLKTDMVQELKKKNKNIKLIVMSTELDYLQECLVRFSDAKILDKKMFICAATLSRRDPISGYLKKFFDEIFEA